MEQAHRNKRRGPTWPEVPFFYTCKIKRRHSEKVERLLLFLINKTRKTKTSPLAKEKARKHKSNKYNIGDIKLSPDIRYKWAKRS